MVAFMEAFVDSRKIWSGLSLVDQATSRQVFGSICYNSVTVIYILQIISPTCRVKAA